jgi:hypothetical protein
MDPAICSRNEKFEDTSLDGPVDACLSVSVMEHLPRSARIRWVEKFAALLRHKGPLLLTVDLVPNTDELWPYAEGRLVESHDEHGALDAMLSEIVRAGFRIEEVQRVRNLPATRIDIALMRAVRDKVGDFSLGTSTSSTQVHPDNGWENSRHRCGFQDTPHLASNCLRLFSKSSA